MIEDVLKEVSNEVNRQYALWGEQNHPDGTDQELFSEPLRVRRDQYEVAHSADALTYRHILLEEVYEALAEEDKNMLREELIQVAAVAVSWVQKLDRELR